MNIPPAGILSALADASLAARIGLVPPTWLVELVRLEAERAARQRKIRRAREWRARDRRIRYGWIREDRT